MIETNDRQTKLTGTIFCIGALLFWSGGPIFIKLLTGHFDLWTQNLLRYLVACLFWLPFLIFTITTKRFDHNIWRRALLPSLANVIMQSLWTAGFYYLDPGFMVLLSQTSVIWVAGFSIIFFHQERGLVKSVYFWLGLVLSAVGVAGVIFFKDDFFTQKTVIGILIVFASSFCWAIYAISAKVAFKEAGACRGFSVVTIYTVLGLAVLAGVFGDMGNCLTIGSEPWFYIVVSAILSIAIAHAFYYAAIRRIGAAIPAVVLLSLPFIVLAISSVVFAERLNTLQWIFGVVLLTGAGLSICAQNRLR